MSNCVHQLVHTLSYGDAISGEVLALKRVLQAQGCESEIFSIHTHPKLHGQASSYLDFPKNFKGTVILHYSLGSPLNQLYRSLTSARRALIYHNLTPAHWFEGVNPRIQADIELGQRELPELCGITDLLLADSEYNASELRNLGFMNAQVLNLPLDPRRWELERSAGIYNIVKNDPAIHLMHVGRLAPNKCIEDIIKIFYFLHHKLEPKSVLWLVGIDTDTELYSFSLKRLVDELGLTDAVRFVGCFADSEVKALYESASVYVCMSEHEGFCVPVIEAMHFGLPVIAYASSALPDTIGAGGILVSEKKHPEIAELIRQLQIDQNLRNRLIQAGKQRVSELSIVAFEQRVKELFELEVRNLEAVQTSSISA